MNRLKYPEYVPKWYNPETSYLLMLKYGIHSKELKDYLDKGIVRGDTNV